MSDETTTLLVQGLNGEGPGDIVGAVVNEANVDPDAIGAIDIEGDTATVDVTADVADRIVQSLDGGRIGTATVSIAALDEETRTARAYADRLTDLVELEREEEMRRHEQEIENLSGRERERRGRALLRMRGRDEGEGLGGHRVKFMRQEKGQPLPDHELRVGDLVMVSKKDPLRDDNPTGTVTQVTNYSVTVSFGSKPDGWVFGKGLRVDLYVNDITYQRMQDALAQLPTAEGTLAHLRDVCTGASSPAEADAVDVGDWHNPVLNASQRQAVREALGTNDVHLIHGPPGTGKTTTAIEVIRQCLDRGESVLATAASNTAVDNMVELLVEQGEEVVRLGHPARVTEALHAHTLDAQIEDNDTYRRSQARREDAFDLLEEQDDLTHPSGRWRRGMSDRKIQELAEEGRGSRGVPPEKIEEMAEWLDLRDKADDLFDEAERLEQEAIDEVLSAADVVCSTNSTAGSDLLQHQTFDTLIVDEATQATAPSCWIPMTHARRAILVGDHKQLPPTILNPEAAESGLQYTLFERLAKHHETDPETPNSIRSLLRTQYRMHETIMGFSSRTFYDDRLLADDAVRQHTLADLGVPPGDLPPERREILDPEAPFVFVDTAGIEAPERQRSGSHSRENPREAELVAQLVTDLLNAEMAPGQIAVISPYDDQVDRIEQRLDIDELEVDTVDGFQGREKEVVIVSLVRSNERGAIGFLDEPRRFNVALTRAKRKAIVVGDSTTVTHADVFADVQAYAQNEGREVRL
ncbi:AAA family ATPase [Salinibacter sp. 10B]|uniref:IGHMBP2 family helicase n=1 Tax=Salinibacter sp. 10B TaxID=1923971 RepID=UPI000CF432DA|nr:IGHMBP2 family helicase [Salinibacter sp. 10B]PQJ34765.1 AAA family ATPase [Salinibacter sp. 10B]